MRIIRIIRLFIMFAIFTSVVLVTNPAQAYLTNSFNCGGGSQPVLAGDDEGAVRSKCGAPTYTEGTAWIYDRGLDSTIGIIYDSSIPFRRRVLGIEIKLKTTDK